MNIDREQVLHVARLASLELKEHEVSYYQEQLGKILDYVQVLNAAAITTADFGTLAVEGALERPDQTFPSLSNEEALQGAPLSRNGMFQVPKIIE